MKKAIFKFKRASFSEQHAQNTGVKFYTPTLDICEDGSATAFGASAHAALLSLTGKNFTFDEKVKFLIKRTGINPEFA